MEGLVFADEVSYGTSGDESFVGGDSATAIRASHWRAISRSCPRCQHPEETVEHQLWSCPRWHATRVRAAAAFGVDIDALTSRLGPLTLHSLLRPPCPAAQAAARLLTQVPRSLPSLGLKAQDGR